LVLHEWLSEVVYALAHRAAGLNGVAWLTALLLASIYSLLAAGLRMLGVSAPVAFLAALAAYFTGMIHHLPRPHLFTLLLFTVFVLCLEGYRLRRVEGGKGGGEAFRSKRHSLRDLSLLVALVPVTVLWANFNGAFVLAFFILVIYILGALADRELRPALIYLVTLAACFAASLVNPFGIGLPQHVLGFMGNRFLVDNTVEYLSPNFHNLSAWPFAAWILFSLILFGRMMTRVSWTGLLLLGAWTAFGLYSARNIANYAQVAAIITAPAGEAWLAASLPALRVRLQNMSAVAPVGAGWVWGIGVLALLIALQGNGVNLDVRGQGNIFTTRAFPVDAVNYLVKNPPQGNMFNEYTWGGYLEYRLFPGQRVFIDGDNDFFGEGLVREYLDAVNAREGWEGILDKYRVAWVILPPGRPLSQALGRSDGWSEVYRDEGAGVWVRR
jgi:hypothetical protein